MAQDMYLYLDHSAYKVFENQLKDYQSLETTHMTEDKRYYHKSFRLRLGELTLEVMGPSVRGNGSIDG